ncbi:MAG: sulfotransferase family 2 domain-containing protein [Cyclobacteriaceae bacterium]
MANIISLLTLIKNYGSVNNPITNFPAIRKKYLSGLELFLPDSQIPGLSDRVGNSKIRHLRSFASLVKGAIKTHGGHLLVPEKKLFYVRIPKSANTSCSAALLRVNFPDLPETLNAHQINLLTDSWLRREVSPSLKNFTGFTVVRHPLKRLVSVYQTFFEQGTDDFIYNGYLFGVLPKTLSFDEFVFRISKIPDKLKDQHIRPQACFLEAYRKRNVPVRVFKIEQIDELQNFLSSFSMELSHLNRRGESKSIQSYYSASTLQLARKMYASDFSLFNYDQ